MEDRKRNEHIHKIEKERGEVMRNMQELACKKKKIEVMDKGKLQIQRPKTVIGISQKKKKKSFLKFTTTFVGVN